MGKHNNKKKKTLPFVSICTPTFNRRPFVQTMFQCFQNQTYPKDRMEWIIVDDGTDKIEDLIKAANIPQIQYYPLDKKMTLGAKRNFTHSKTKGSILVYMDDDDYYPPERVAHAVETLQSHPQALCAGSSEIYVYFKHISKMYRGGPYNANHATAGTFAFKRELLNQTKYNETACLAEEREFLKNYTIPFVQLDPRKTILVFSHIQNTFDKKRLLETPNPKFVECNDVKIEEFIKFDYEAPIKDYFLKHIEIELEKYKPGDPSMKPDVLEQTKVIEKERAEMQKQMAAQGQGSIVIQRPGEPPKTLTNQDIVQLLEGQKKEIEARGQKIQVLENLIVKMREEIHKLKQVPSNTISTSTSTSALPVPKIPEPILRSFLMPEVQVPMPIPTPFM
jgi:glycosyltransferase involved in cell wall biosynthesis